MPTKESFDIDGLMVFRSDLTAVDQDGNTVASVITPDKYVQNGKEPVSDEQMGRFTNTTAYWNAHSTYIPKKGEVIIYSDGGSITEGGTTVYIPKIKIGDGTTTVVNLPFTDSDTQGGIAGTLNTTNTSAQTPSASESLTGNVKLHKVAKTGSYDDLLNKPTIPDSTSDLTNDSGFITINDVPKEVFVCNYNSSTNTMDKTPQEIYDAKTAGNTVVCFSGNSVHDLNLASHVNNNYLIVFNAIASAHTPDSIQVGYIMYNGSAWSHGITYLQRRLYSSGVEQNIKTVNNESLLGSGNITIHEGDDNVQSDWNQSDNTADDFIKNKPDLNATLYEEITYSQIVTKINNSQLVKGRKYRITDYVTTTTQTNTSSAGHAFDLVVTATDVNKLDCMASALLHSGDTYFSTAGADLSKWQIWYDVNNDTTKYAWADSTNGKGVIYRMIDEWRNDCPYDFKNILFTKADAYESAYTFTKTVSSSSPKTDHSLTGECFSNIINDYYKSLGFIVFLCNSQHTVDVYKNYFDIGCHDILSKGTCCYNKLGEDCEDILFDSSSYNALAKYCQGVTFGAGCSNNVIEIESFDVVFGSNCFGNVLRGLNETVRLGNSCSNNIIGRGTLTLTFGNSCSANKIGDNSLGISFGNGCAGNVVGYQSYYITLRDYCLRITIASGCASILFGNSSEPSEGGLFCKDITIDEGCQYIRIYNTSSPSASNYLQNIYIAQGVSGTSSSYFEISTIARNLSYRTTVGRDSSGNIRIYNEDDPASASQAQANWNETSSSSPSYIQNKPTIPAAQVNSDWNASSGVAKILNKPNLATVATSGSYNDLSNKPTIPDPLPSITNNAGKILAVNSTGTSTEWKSTDDLKAFKGWFNSTSALSAAYQSPKVGDYAYIKGATASDPAAIYECATAGTWSDSGRTVDTSSVQTFASGESVNEVSIEQSLGESDINLVSQKCLTDIMISSVEISRADFDLLNGYIKADSSKPSGYVFTTSTYVGGVKHIDNKDFTSVTITANGEHTCYLCFLKKKPTTPNTEPVFCDGTTRYTINVGKTNTYNIPNDAVYLYIYFGISPYAYTPSKIMLNKNKVHTADNKCDILYDDYAEHSLTFNSYGEHSSFKDQLSVNLKQGDVYYIKAESDTTTNYTLYAYNNGTGYVITGGLVFGITYRFVANTNIQAIGLYYNAPSTSVNVTFRVFGKKLAYVLDGEEAYNRVVGTSIVDYNKEEVLILKAQKDILGYYGTNKNVYFPSFAIATDIHSDKERFNRIFDLCNLSEINSMFVLGDLVEGGNDWSTFSDWQDKVLSITKPVLSIPGNHEFTQSVSAGNQLTDNQIADRYYSEQMVTHNGDVHPTISGVVKPYFTRNFTTSFNGTTYTIKCIFLYQYERPFVAPSGSSIPADHGKDGVYYTQEQIDWVLEQLDDCISNGYIAIICSHAPISDYYLPNIPFNPIYYGNKQISWSYEENKSMFEEILNAYVTGGSIDGTYRFIGKDLENGAYPVLSTITINHSFGGVGKFACNICGHAHDGGVGYLGTESTHNTLLRIVVSPVGSSYSVQTKNNWSRRAYDKLQDCVNVITYDAIRDKVKIVRFGSNITNDGDIVKSYSF